MLAVALTASEEIANAQKRILFQVCDSGAEFNSSNTDTDTDDTLKLLKLLALV